MDGIPCSLVKKRGEWTIMPLQSKHPVLTGHIVKDEQPFKSGGYITSIPTERFPVEIQYSCGCRLVVNISKPFQTVLDFAKTFPCNDCWKR